MKRFVEGQSRTQGALLPETLDDFVAEANPVRVIDVFIEELDLRKLGFAGVDPAATGRPAIIRLCFSSSTKIVAEGINWQTAPLIYKRPTQFALQLLAEMSA